MKKIAAYVRVSTKEAAKRKEGSLKAQVQRIQMRIEERNRFSELKWGTLVDIYKDEALSGKNTDRPEYQRMVADVSAGRVDTVMVTELSRLSRSVLDFLSFMNFLKDNNADFISLQQDLDTSTPIGKMIMTIMIALYEFEREQTVERIKNNYWVRSLRGLLNGGSPFLGYDRDLQKSGNLVVNEPEADTVRWLFDAYFKSGSLSETLRLANSKGLINKAWTTKEGKQRGGSPFSLTSIHYILTNQSYIAKKVLNRENRDKDTETLKEQEKFLEIDAVWKPVINEELFSKVQAKLVSNKKENGWNGKNYDFYLSGILFCDECGRPLNGKTGHGRLGLHYYYGHSPSKKSHCRIQNYPALKLEALIRNEVTALIGENGDLERFVERFHQFAADGVKNVDSLLGAVKRQIEEADNKKRNLVSVIASTPEASQIKSLVTEVKALEDQIAGLEEKREDLKIERLQTAQNQADKSFIIERIQKFKGQGFDRAPISGKKDVVKSLFKSIHINPENVIRLDVWATQYHERHSERAKATTSGMTQVANVEGAVIPFAQIAPAQSASPESADDGAFSASGFGELMVAGSSVVQKNRGAGI